MIYGVRLVNIQSFKDVKFYFRNDAVNVLEAPNETGKSILFKVMRIMCDANWYGRGKRKDLIRNGCNRGVALFLVTKDKGYYTIRFELYSTHQVYRLYDGDELINSWKSDTMPSKLYDILKWHYDYDSKRLLNLCDQELEMPFTGSNGKSNFESMKFIFNDVRLDSARETLKQWLEEISYLEMSVTGKQSELYAVYNSIDYVDTDKLSKSIDRREKILKEVETLANIIETLDECVKLEKPVIKFHDIESIDGIISVCESLRTIGIKLQDTIKLNKPQIIEVDCNDIEDTISIVKSLNIIAYNGSKLIDNINKSKNVSERIDTVMSNISEFERINEICPLCGSKFNQ